MAVALVADKTEVTTLSPARAALAEHLAALAKLRSEVERNQKPVDRLREQGRVAGEPCQICALTLGFARLRERATERAAVAQLVRAEPQPKKTQTHDPLIHYQTLCSLEAQKPPQWRKAVDLLCDLSVGNLVNCGVAKA
jgi:hypothetical protein